MWPTDNFNWFEHRAIKSLNSYFTLWKTWMFASVDRLRRLSLRVFFHSMVCLNRRHKKTAMGFKIKPRVQSTWCSLWFQIFRIFSLFSSFMTRRLWNRTRRKMTADDNVHLFMPTFFSASFHINLLLYNNVIEDDGWWSNWFPYSICAIISDP